MVMDMFGALALATEPPCMTELRGKPVKTYEKVMNPCIWRTILSQAIWVTIVSLVMLFAAPFIFGLYKGDSEIVMPCPTGTANNTICHYP